MMEFCADSVWFCCVVPACLQQHFGEHGGSGSAFGSPCGQAGFVFQLQAAEQNYRSGLTTCCTGKTASHPLGFTLAVVSVSSQHRV